MIITLYKNSQTEGEKKSDIFTDLWQLIPYEPDTLFASGFTSEKADYEIPGEYEVTKENGKHYLKKTNYLYEIFNNKDGKPGLRVLNGGISCAELQKPGEKPEKPKTEPKPSSMKWVPQFINGEWEIY